MLGLTLFLVGVQYTASGKKNLKHQASFSSLLPAQRLRDTNSWHDDSNAGVHFIPRQKAEGVLPPMPPAKPVFSPVDHGLVAPPPNRPQIKQQIGLFDGAEYDNPQQNLYYKNKGDQEVETEPYIPEKRLIHFDLKGAPPKLDYLIKVLNLSAKMGATGVLMEYEDMFPFQGRLQGISALNHYNKSDIQALLDACRQLKMEVIPLVQTFGHMEFILKLKEFSHLRDNEDMPESICACHDQSMPLIQTYIDQVMSLHPDVKYLHVGCDEVYHMGECASCMAQGLSRTELFVSHVTKVAKYVKSKYKVNVIIWDDMLRNFMATEMEPLAKLVQPMVWVYAEDVYRFFPTYNWDKLAEVFDSVWTASAFKGAHGPTLTVPPIEKHLTNTLNWLNVMQQEGSKFKKGFYGLVTTGWQRYDHFAVLCEVLPVSIPSLAVNLIAMQHGYFNSSLKTALYNGLECSTDSNLASSEKFKTFINLEEDPYLWQKLSWCFFPGTRAFQMTQQLDYVSSDVNTYLEKATKEQGWLTDFSINRNYTSPFRVNEGTDELSQHVYSVTSLIKVAKQALEEFFDEYTVAEWIEQKIYPLYHQLQDLKNKAKSVKKRRHWYRRPFTPNKALEAFGIGQDQDQHQRQKSPSVISTARPKRLVQQPDYYRNPPSVVIGA